MCVLHMCVLHGFFPPWHKFDGHHGRLCTLISHRNETEAFSLARTENKTLLFLSWTIIMIQSPVTLIFILILLRVQY